MALRIMVGFGPGGRLCGSFRPAACGQFRVGGVAWSARRVAGRVDGRRIPVGRVGHSVFRIPCTRAGDDLGRPVVSREALTEYLQGSWFEAEAILGRLLRQVPRDVEGRLLLATVLRRTQRHDEALEQLDRLERLRDAARWSREIADERQRIAEAIAGAGLADPISVEDLADELVARQAA